MDESFSMKTDYTVGTVMCDRGTDSVYCLSVNRIMISVSDENTGNLIVKKDGKTINAVDLNGAETKKGLRVIDIKSLVREPGYYTIETDNEEDITQESFYVPANLSAPIFASNAQNETMITIPNYNEFLYAEIAYRRTYPGTNVSETIFQEYVREQVVADGQGGCTLTVPTTILSDTDNPATILLRSCYFNYLTQYGSYWLNGNGVMSAEYSATY
ncbi:MAG: hypothetical protein IJV46_00410 [Acidaminococcaceae bacterium]|nr:hypothetical protein [Acidaminococcaceae bacterium]